MMPTEAEMTLEEFVSQLREDRVALVNALNLTANYSYSVDPHLKEIFAQQKKILSEVILRSLNQRSQYADG